MTKCIICGWEHGCDCVVETVSMSSAPAPCSDAWREEAHSGMKLWLWCPSESLSYMVVKHVEDAVWEAHVTTGTRYKYVQAIGYEFTSKEDAQAACTAHHGRLNSQLNEPSS